MCIPRQSYCQCNSFPEAGFARTTPGTAAVHVCLTETKLSQRAPRRVREQMEEVHRESLEEEATHATDEARMVLPGVQAILGF